MTLRFEWDEEKRRANLRKHGIDLADCTAVFDGYTVTAEDSRFDYAEQRFATFGLTQGRVIVITHTETLHAIRFISAREATRHEREIYFARIAH
jgi:uncharacterized DUF497 family protein